MPIEAAKADGGVVPADGEADDGCGGGQVEGEAAARVPLKVEIAVAVDEEVHVRAVPVRPACREGGAGAEADVILAAERMGEGTLNRLEKFGRTGGDSAMSMVPFADIRLLPSFADIDDLSLFAYIQ